MKKPFLLLVLFTFVLVSACEESVLVEPEIDESVTAWQNDERFLFKDKVQHNSYADSNRIDFLGMESYSRIEMEGDSEKLSYPAIVSGFNSNYRMPIGESICVTSREISLTINHTASAISPLILFMKDLDSAFYRFDFPTFEIGEAIAINSNNQFLVPYNILHTNEEDYGTIIDLRLLLASSAVLEDQNRMVLSDSKIITLQEIPISNGAISLHSFDDFFFVSGLQKTYKIESDGEVAVILNERLYKIFRIGDNFYGTNGYQMFKSENGNDWVFSSEIQLEFSWLNFKIIDNKTIAFYNSQIFHITEKEGSLWITELDNEGLYGHTITSIASFNDKVYVSTLSGVFTKKKEGFWLEKNDAEDLE